MGGSESKIVNYEDVKQKYTANGIDVSKACGSDAICPPDKFKQEFDTFRNKFDDNDNDNDNDNGNDIILILIILMILSSSIYILKHI
jgi:hypothetical protein